MRSTQNQLDLIVELICKIHIELPSMTTCRVRFKRRRASSFLLDSEIARSIVSRQNRIMELYTESVARH